MFAIKVLISIPEFVFTKRTILWAIIKESKWDRIKCITLKIDHLSMEEVQEGLRFPLARRWSRSRIETNIPTNSVRLIRIIFDRLHINEVHFLIFMN